MNEPAATIFVVEDDPLVRSLVELIIAPLAMPIASFGTAAEFLGSYEPARPGCVVSDVRMPGMSGLELQQELNARGATLPVIFITAHADVPTAVAAMQSGAFDFLVKPLEHVEFVRKVRAALARDEETRRALRQTDAIRARFNCLTARERELAKLLLDGLSNKAIGAELGLSQRTVELHRANLLEKMGAASLAHLVRMLMDLERSAGSSAR